MWLAAASLAGSLFLLTATARPVIDGRSLCGVSIGRSVEDVYALAGVPDGRGYSSLAEVALRYDLPFGEILQVHLEGGQVVAVETTAVVPATSWGVRIGDPVGLVVERYGGVPGLVIWYAERGLAFVTDGEVVTGVIVFARGRAAPQ